ncbi:MAG: hypothetical protein R2860_03765 [Desulfobacterales bacterium]
MDKTPETLTRDDLLEVISERRMDPRVIYPSGEKNAYLTGSPLWSIL